MIKNSRENIAGFSVDTQGVKSIVTSVIDFIDKSGANESCKWLACMNPHSYAESLDDDLFKAALHNTDWLIPDGSGVVLASRILNGSISERVTGSDIFQGVCRKMDSKGVGRVFFLGSTEETLAKIRTLVATDYPNLEIVGTYSPPFKFDYSESELDDMVEAINAVSPDVLWVGMTAPKQEKWLFQQAP